MNLDTGRLRRPRHDASYTTLLASAGATRDVPPAAVALVQSMERLGLVTAGINFDAATISDLAALVARLESGNVEEGARRHLIEQHNQHFGQLAGVRHHRGGDGDRRRTDSSVLSGGPLRDMLLAAMQTGGEDRASRHWPREIPSHSGAPGTVVPDRRAVGRIIDAAARRPDGQPIIGDPADRATVVAGVSGTAHAHRNAALLVSDLSRPAAERAEAVGAVTGFSADLLTSAAAAVAPTDHAAAMDALQRYRASAAALIAGNTPGHAEILATSLTRLSTRLDACALEIGRTGDVAAMHSCVSQAYTAENGILARLQIGVRTAPAQRPPSAADPLP